jgi:tRNA threonylcarbamoyladenosine biosynthesis protein TsaE
VIELHSESAEVTRFVAETIAALARAGDLVLLVGEMGTGKTAFAQGFAIGLGIHEPVTSPTFNLVRSYPGRLVLHHLDVYRLDRLAEVDDLAIGELLEDKSVTLIEWGDAVVGALPADYLEVRFSFGAADDHRELHLRVVGPSWSSRQRVLTEALEAWRC